MPMTDKLDGKQWPTWLPYAINIPACAFIGCALGAGDKGIEWSLLAIGATAGGFIGALLGLYEQRKAARQKRRRPVNSDKAKD
jgi:hypothetical protein